MYQIEVITTGSTDTKAVDYTLKVKDANELISAINILANTGVKRFLISVISSGD